MKIIAIFGASSQIAKDLTLSFAENAKFSLLLYVRDVKSHAAWLKDNSLHNLKFLYHYDEYGHMPHDVVINFIGVGDPKRAIDIGASILQLTIKYDDVIINGLANNPDRRYIFLSSGAVYGNSFLNPVNEETLSSIRINNIKPQEYYSVAKLHAEVRHRSLNEYQIVDLRVFNYFSRNLNIEARYLITDAIRAIRDHSILSVSSEQVVRDYIHPADFSQLVSCIISSPPINTAIDCYSLSSISKSQILEALQKKFGLQYEYKVDSEIIALNATGSKPYYYSLNHRASDYGYKPEYSSLDCILIEASAMLGKSLLV
jgi:nucleoside-diphosphate-sugar epimerase